MRYTIALSLAVLVFTAFSPAWGLTLGNFVGWQQDDAVSTLETGG